LAHSDGIAALNPSCSMLHRHDDALALLMEVLDENP
jgi:hypothetical protein